SYVLPAGSLTGFASFSGASLSFSTPSANFIAPLVVGGNVNLTSATGSGSSPVAIMSSGNLLLAGSVTNVSAVQSASPVWLASQQALSIAGGVNVISSSGNSANASLIGSSVAVTGNA